MEFSRCARYRKAGLARPVSQNSTACEPADVEVDVLLGDPIDRTTEVINGSEAPGGVMLQIP
jgi:hypothetical protein